MWLITSLRVESNAQMLWQNQNYVETVLEDIEVTMFIGICDHEYETPQRVHVNVKLFQNLDRLAPKDITECINYVDVHDYVAAWKTRPHTDLIETLLENLVQFCLKDTRIDACWASIKKPDIFDDTKYVGIQAYRTR